MERLSPSHTRSLRRGLHVVTLASVLSVSGCGPSRSIEHSATATPTKQTCNSSMGVTLYTRPNYQGDCKNFPQEGTYVLDQYNELYPHVESLRDPRHCHIEFRDKGNRPSYYDNDTPILSPADIDQEYILKFESCK